MAYMFKVTINSAKVTGSSPETGLRILFNQKCLDFPADFWSQVTDLDGLDIRFYSDEVKTSEYDREIVYYNSSEQIVEAWVRINPVSNSVDQDFYCEVGGVTKANDYNWGGEEYVFHCSKDTDDSSINGRDAVPNNISYVASEISKAADFNGTDSEAVASNWTVTDSWNCRAMIRPEAYGDAGLAAELLRRRVWFGRTNICDTAEDAFKGFRSFMLGVDSGGFLSVDVNWVDGALCTGTSGTTRYTSNIQVPLNSWSYVMVAVNSWITEASRQVKMWINGVEASVVKVGSTGRADNDASEVTKIGGYNKPSYNSQGKWDGQIEEIRLKEGYVTTNELYFTEYNNYSDPSTFLTCSEFQSISSESSDSSKSSDLSVSSESSSSDSISSESSKSSDSSVSSESSSSESSSSGSVSSESSDSSKSSVSSESSSSDSISSESSDSSALSTASVSSDSSFQFNLNELSRLDEGDTIDVTDFDVNTISTLNEGGLLLVDSVAADSNFNNSNKWNVVVIVYRHTGGQRKSIVHKLRSNQWFGYAKFTQSSNSGLWQKMKIILLDRDGDSLVVERDKIGTEEDITIINP